MRVRACARVRIEGECPTPGNVAVIAVVFGEVQVALAGVLRNRRAETVLDDVGEDVKSTVTNAQVHKQFS